jgi:hypothetical protein
MNWCPTLAAPLFLRPGWGFCFSGETRPVISTTKPWCRRSRSWDLCRTPQGRQDNYAAKPRLYSRSALQGPMPSGALHRWGRGARFSRFLWLTGREGESHWHRPDPAPLILLPIKQSSSCSTLIHFVTFDPRAVANPSDHRCRILSVLHRMQVQVFATARQRGASGALPGVSRVHDPGWNRMVQSN